MKNIKIFKEIFFASSLIMAFLGLNSVYADVVYPNDYEPTMPYLVTVFSVLAVVVAIGIVILIKLHKSSEMKNNKEENNDVEKGG